MRAAAMCGDELNKLVKNAPSGSLHLLSITQLANTVTTPYTHYLSTLKVQIVHYISEFYLRNPVLTGCQL